LVVLAGKARTISGVGTKYGVTTFKVSNPGFDTLSRLATKQQDRNHDDNYQAEPAAANVVEVSQHGRE